METLKYQRLVTITFIVALLSSTFLVLIPPASSAITASGMLHRSGNRLVDANGNTVILRGADASFVDGPNGNWATHSGFKVSNNGWNTAWVDDNLNARVEWKFNNVRVHITVGAWLQDVSNQRAHLRYLVEQAQARGLYVTISPWSVLWYGQNGFNGQNTAPYPPYLSSQEQAILPNKQAFVNFYTALANDLKGYPNILWEIWNEPHPSDLNDYFVNLVNPTFSAIRATGAQQPIIVAGNWGGIWVGEFDLDAYESHPDWVTNLPDQNIMLSLHVYAYHNHFTGTTPANPTDYNGVKSAFQNAGVYLAGETYPMYFGEIGIERGNSADRSRYDNILRIFYEQGWSWAGWWFRDGEVLSFINYDTSPTAEGLVYQKWLNTYVNNPTPTPTSPPYPTPTPTGLITPTPTPVPVTPTPVPVTPTPIPTVNPSATPTPSSYPTPTPPPSNEDMSFGMIVTVVVCCGLIFAWNEGLLFGKRRRKS